MEGTIPVRGHGIEVRVRDQGGLQTAGWASAVRSDGIEVDFPSRESPALLLGARVMLDVRVPDLDEPLRTTARVERRRVGQDMRCYRFDFEGAGQRDEVPFILRSTLDRRHAVRVAPDDHGQVATLRSECGTEVVAPMTDISESGLGVRVPFPKDRFFAVGDELDLSVEIGGQRLPLRARLYHARAVGGEVLFGIGFTIGACDPEVLAALARHVGSLRAATEP